MRIDVFLHKVCLFRSRTMAGEACDRGKVQLDNAPARASRDVKPGSVIRMDLPAGLLEIETLAVPEGNIPKARAPLYYKILRDERGQRASL
jgi:ribosomal 50S subunit-recycling heat shock protein